MARTLRSRIRGAITVLAEWHPWVLAIALGCVLSGLRGILTPRDPRLTIDQYIHDPYYSLYYVMLMTGGVVMLSSIGFGQLRDRLMIEQIGLWIVSAVLLIYQVALFSRYGEPLGISSLITLLIAIGGLGRIGRILWELHLLGRELP